MLSPPKITNVQGPNRNFKKFGEFNNQIEISKCKESTNWYTIRNFQGKFLQKIAYDLFSFSSKRDSCRFWILPIIMVMKFSSWQRRDSLEPSNLRKKKVMKVRKTCICIRGKSDGFPFHENSVVNISQCSWNSTNQEPLIWSDGCHNDNDEKKLDYTMKVVVKTF